MGYGEAMPGITVTALSWSTSGVVLCASEKNNGRRLTPHVGARRPSLSKHAQYAQAAETAYHVLSVMPTASSLSKMSSPATVSPKADLNASLAQVKEWPVAFTCNKTTSLGFFWRRGAQAHQPEAQPGPAWPKTQELQSLPWT